MEQTQTTQVPEVQQTTETVSQQVASNPFSDSSWTEQAPNQQTQQVQQTTETGDQAQSTAQTQSSTTTQDTEQYDANEYLKARLGFDDWASAKTEIEELRKLRETAQTPAEIKFANEQSQKFFEALKEGKEDDIYNYLQQKKSLERIEKIEISKANEAAEIIKMNLQYKHKDLTPEQIDFLFNRSYGLPPKPVQTDDMLDEEYQQVVDNWKKQVDNVEMGMVIDAKLAKPELLKYKNELILPEITQQSNSRQPTAEEIAKAEQDRTAFLNSVANGLNNLKGFNATYKDEEVEIPISYEATPEEKAKLKPIMESFGQGWGYFENRWLKPDGTVNTDLMSEDLLLLENKGKVFQKFTNETGSQVNLHRMKQKSNIQLNTDANRTTPNDAQQNAVSMAEFFFRS